MLYDAAVLCWITLARRAGRQCEYSCRIRHWQHVLQHNHGQQRAWQAGALATHHGQQ